MAKVYTLIFDSSLEIEDTIPLYPESLYENDRVKSLLAAFGNSCPTLNTGGLMVKFDEVAKPPGIIYYRLVAHNLAVIDTLTILETKKMNNQPPRNQSSKSINRMIRGETRDKLWKVMHSFATKPSEVVEEVGIVRELGDEFQGSMGVGQFF